MTLTLTYVDGNRSVALARLTLDGKPRIWRRPLLVTVQITPFPADPAAAPRAAGADALYALAAPVLGIETAPARSIVEAVWKLEEEIVASLPRDVLESLLLPVEPGTVP